MKVLIVDDSVVFRSQISGALAQIEGIEVAGTAAHGGIALQKLEQLSVDVVVLDMEMPGMNGIEVLREIKKRGFPVRVIVFSSQTQRGAEAALRALREGADDVVAKPSGDHPSLETGADAIRSVLIPRILQFAGKPAEPKNREAPRPVAASPVAREKLEISRYLPEILVIGSSTGGPNALEKIFASIQGPSRIPILIVQHMPPVFTEILARRLGDLTGIPAGEAKPGEPVLANRIYVAPGEYHMQLEGGRGQAKVNLNQGPRRCSVRPAVDNLFESAAAVYGKHCLGVVLTGMGEDGLLGAREIRRQGGPVLIQDRESCVVFGMPGAIFEADEYDQMADLGGIAQLLKRVLFADASAR